SNRCLRFSLPLAASTDDAPCNRPEQPRNEHPRDQEHDQLHERRDGTREYIDRIAECAQDRPQRTDREAALAFSQLNADIRLRNVRIEVSDLALELLELCCRARQLTLHRNEVLDAAAPIDELTQSPHGFLLHGKSRLD